jgi:uncharacterized protein involved in outer membrane biogenesis
MNGKLAFRRGLKWTGGVLALLIITTLALALVLRAGYLRGPLVRLLAARTGRAIDVAGSLETRVFARNPRLTAERVSIGNPPWTAPGLTAEIRKVTVVFATPGFGHWLEIERIEMEGATLYLTRNSAGHANWQRSDPDKHIDTPLALIRGLSMPDAHVTLQDDLRHLQFDGSVSIHDMNAAGVSALRIDGAGRLNDRAATFEIAGDPLATAKPDAPYRFTFAEHSSGSELTARGSLSKPFTFDQLDATFEASGADLKDIYFLTGVSLVNTDSYRLAGTMARRGTHTRFGDLVATFGGSDLRGTVSIDSSSGRPKLDARLDSQVLRAADLGLRAAGRESGNSTHDRWLLSDTRLNPLTVRHGDGVITYQARRIDVGRVVLRAVAGRMTIDQGVLVINPLSADVFEGKLAASLKLDANPDIPVATVDLGIAGLQLAQLDQRAPGPPRLQGLLHVKAAILGHGASLHQIAASGNGSLTATWTRGSIRTSLAELTGIDLRGLGLLLTKNQQETVVRCAAVRFQERDGTLTAQSLIVDTDPVLITGAGQIQLDSETLDLAFRGHPKKLRLLRLRSPLMVRGTLLHPSISIDTGQSSLVLIDPGSAKDVDCDSL